MKIRLVNNEDETEGRGTIEIEFKWDQDVMMTGMTSMPRFSEKCWYAGNILHTYLIHRHKYFYFSENTCRNIKQKFSMTNRICRIFKKNYRIVKCTVKHATKQQLTVTNHTRSS